MRFRHSASLPARRRPQTATDARPRSCSPSADSSSPSPSQSTISWQPWKPRRRPSGRALELEVTSREAELRALRAQINPHFLFNSLNSISSLAGRDAKKARQVCSLLGDFLRASLSLGSRDAIPLSVEIDLAEKLLQIEKIRFGDRLSFQLRGGARGRRARGPAAAASAARRERRHPRHRRARRWRGRRRRRSPGGHDAQDHDRERHRGQPGVEPRHRLERSGGALRYRPRETQAGWQARHGSGSPERAAARRHDLRARGRDGGSSRAGALPCHPPASHG